MRGTDKNDVGYGNVFAAGKDHAAPRVPVQRGQIDDACTADADIFLSLRMDKILIIRLSSPIVCFQNRLRFVRLLRYEDRSGRKIQCLPAFELLCADTVNARSKKQDGIIVRLRRGGCIICAENCQRVQVAAVRLNEEVVRFRSGKAQRLTAKHSGQMQRFR